MSTHEIPPVKAGLPLLALAVGAFGIGITEFSPMGLLPVISVSARSPARSSPWPDWCWY